MILSISSSISTFKTIRMGPGLNVLLADASSEEQSGNTRNSAGKSSFVQIVDFLLGSSCDRNSLFRSASLNSESFIGSFRIQDKNVQVERTGSDPSKIFILSNPEDFGPILKNESSTDRPYISLTHWKDFLGQSYFKLPTPTENSDFKQPYSPTTRSMIKYFCRMNGDGGFDYPERSYRVQKKSSWQPSLSYMFGLEWRISRGFQKVRDEEKALKTLKKNAENGVVDEVIGTVAKIRPQLVLTEKKAQDKRNQVVNFEVLETYRDIAENAATFRLQMKEASIELVSLRETLGFLLESYEQEQPTYTVDIKSMYEASGIELPQVALRRFEEVAVFQKSVISNRKVHLQSDIEQTRRAISDVENVLEMAGEGRKEALLSLKGKGAFEDLVEQQRELSTIEAEYASLKKRFDTAQILEGSGADLKVDRIELHRRLKIDHETHSKTLDSIILRISELITALYKDRDGYFEPSATENGPEFNIHIPGDRGTGISSMEIFCMDIALFESVRKRFGGTGFLIHDSHLFDGVDARQVLSALDLGRQTAGREQQYIVTLNSDIFDSLPFGKDFNKEEIVIQTRLSDEGDTGGLFGFRFD